MAESKKSDAKEEAAAKAEAAAKRKAAEEKAAEEAAAELAAEEAAAEEERQAQLAAERAELERVLEGDELEDKFAAALKFHHQYGRPEVAAKLKYLRESDQDITAHLVRTDIENPFLVNSGIPPEPPRNGPGSGVGAWRAFAKAVAGDQIADTLIDNVDRDDIVLMLEANGYIESSRAAVPGSEEEQS